MGRRQRTGKPDSREAVKAASPALADRSGVGAFTLPLLLVTFVAVVLVFLVQRPVLKAGALSFDDGAYLVNNPLVQRPSWESVRRFTVEVLDPSTVGGYYQPLSMISLMLDSAMGGRPNHLLPFHRTSLLIHLINVALLIMLLYRLFGDVWVAGAVGLLFGIHPLTVEVLAWVGERKTLLATAFGLGSILAYVSFAQRRGWARYAGCVGLFVLALLSKPTLTPLPVLLLLLDVWPLRRMKGVGVLVEKLPLFAVAGVSALVTLMSQGQTAELQATRGAGSVWDFPLVFCHNTLFYPFKMLWPATLTTIYPFPEPMTLRHPVVLVGVMGTVLLLAALVVAWRRTRGPMVGWLFFTFALLPTQVTFAYSLGIAHDKYAYFPMVGLLLPLTAGLVWLMERHGKALIRGSIVGVALLMTVVLSVRTQAQIRNWKDSATLQRHILSVAPDAVEVRVELGVALKNAGDLAGAREQADEIIKRSPADYRGYQIRGDVHAAGNELPAAIGQYEKAISLTPERKRHEVLNNLGIAVARNGDVQRALGLFQDAVELNPDYADAYNNLGNAHLFVGDRDAAMEAYERAIEIRPHYADALSNLGGVLIEEGRIDAAIELLEQAVQVAPGHADATRHLAVAREARGKHKVE